MPSIANCDRLAAPSQYQILRALVNVTSLPSLDLRLPANTPAEYVLTITYPPSHIDSFLGAYSTPSIQIVLIIFLQQF